MPIKLNKEDLRIIKNAELKIVAEIDRICRKYEIRYSIIGGTLLGAIRHKGFIPWDDDIDLIMVRQDYDKFLKVAIDELGRDFFIANYEKTPTIGEPFTKVMMKETIMKEEFIGDSNAPSGIFVDIFPLDVEPDSKVKKIVHRYTNYILRKKILIKSGYNFNKHGIKKILYDLLNVFTFSSKKKLIKRYRRNQIRYKENQSLNYVSLCGLYGYEKETLPRKWFDEYIFLEFENIKLMALKNYDEILVHYFGDYMKLPPKEQQINKHTVIELDLSKLGGRKIKGEA